MHVDNLRQAEALLAALAVGVGAGLLYDLLRPPRWQRRGLWAFLADALFCLALGAGLFVYAMSFGDGRLGIHALAAAWAGFLAYHALLSPLCLPLFVKAFQILDDSTLFLQKNLKKITISAKKFFKK